MKRQTFGIATIKQARDFLPFPFSLFPVYLKFITSPYTKMLDAAVNDFIKKRQNGKAIDNPHREMPKDGTYTWVNCGVKRSDGYYDYELRYDAGHGDLAWMAEKDRHYQAHLIKKRETKSAELKTTVINEMLANLGNEVNLAEFIATIENEAIRRAQTFTWYTHFDLPIGIHPYDFHPNTEDIGKLFAIISKNPAVTTLNLINMDLSDDLCKLLFELLSARNNNLIKLKLDNNFLDLQEVINTSYPKLPKANDGIGVGFLLKPDYTEDWHGFCLNYPHY